eukprot:CAMPEP_0174968226 /NCGR_PEP_ID=MMETSP0004_2-20121128/8014_1 /TAXON_ID=420556 /ORGANISM="Ochromonas sp., Strain CCMP1393" /LENGTH=130 /DNA_ID=CAMNT_0016217431 /DNA_START=42 /DNA_END=434 /DNA_ORIENTATION=-
MADKVIVDQRKEAMDYIRDKKINKLFDILGSQLAKEKPEDPNEFLLSELKRIAELKSLSQPVTIFAERDIEIMFSIFDLTNRGYVDQTQYAKALEAVGISEAKLAKPKTANIDKKTFISHVYAEVINDSY